MGPFTRTPDPTDRRRHRIDVTPAARKLLQQLRPRVERADEAALQALSSAEQHTLGALLQRLLDSHDQAHAGRRDQAPAKP